MSLFIFGVYFMEVMGVLFGLAGVGASGFALYRLSTSWMGADQAPPEEIAPEPIPSSLDLRDQPSHLEGDSLGDAFNRLDALIESKNLYLLEFKNELAEFRAELAEFKAEFRADLAEFKAEFRADLAEFKAELAEFKAEFKAEFYSLNEQISFLESNSVHSGPSDLLTGPAVLASSSSPHCSSVLADEELQPGAPVSVTLAASFGSPIQGSETQPGVQTPPTCQVLNADSLVRYKNS